MHTNVIFISEVNILTREKIYKNRVKLKLQQQQQKQDQLKELADIEQEEKTKFKVQIPHDGRPETNTYPMILDATSSFDPDQGDRIRFSWKQLSGNKIRLRPNSSSGISFF